MLLLLMPLAGARESVVIYRCTDSAGALTMQNDVPCPAGTRQEREVIESPLPPLAPAYIPPAPEPPPPPPAEPTRNAEAVMDPIKERPPLPGLFQCRTWDDRRYLTDDSAPAERCAPLQTVGIGGAPGVGAGAACEMVTDTCEQLPAEGLCAAWQMRLREAQADLRFGRYERLQSVEAEIERVSAIIARSGCTR
ncbi:MAG: DUF4124 domain-containing protein [Pseudomonadota bacterium]|nr:DUF4124 domain-containing protein [Pseudomonadota bacterium]